MQIFLGKLFLLLLLLSCANGQTVQGFVRDTKGEPLPHAVVVADSGKSGTITDAQGFYTLKLGAGTHLLQYRYIGYKTESRTLNVSGVEVLDITLKEEVLSTPNIYVTGDGKDPSYSIIKKARDQRKHFKEQLGNHRYNAYSKTRFDLISVPDRIPFASQEDLEDLDSLLEHSNILLLTESQSIVEKEPPNKAKETIVASKISGNRDAYSMLATIYLDFDINDNIIDMEGLSERGGFFSPIGSGAFINYHYKLLGMSEEDGRYIYKIEVIPRRKNDPVFSGTIWIIDSSWAVQGFDLIATRERQLKILDTLNVKQTNIPESNLWLPRNIHFKMKGIIMTFDFVGYVTAVYSNYQMNTQADFSNEIVRIADDVIKTDSTYWDRERPIPLDSLEERDYHVKDSLETLENSPEYLDSLTRVNNRFRFTNLLTSYTYRNYRTKGTFTIVSPLSNAGFNTIEGWQGHLELNKYWRPKKYKELELDNKLRFGDAINRIFYTGELTYRRNGYRKEGKHKEPLSLSIMGGNYVSEFGQHQQISSLANSLYTLYDKNNYLKLYEKSYVGIEYSQRIGPLFTLILSSQWQERKALSNNTDFTFSTTEPPYTSNIRTPAHSVLLNEISLAIQPGNKFISTPDGRRYFGSKWPVFTIDYTYGQYLNTELDNGLFNKIGLSIAQTQKMAALGKLEMILRGGTITDSVQFMDYQHFKGNQTIIGQGSAIDRFNTQDYYSYATNSWWLETHAEHHFKGFLWNKLPLLKKLKWHTIGGIHLLSTERGEYAEWSVGLENIGIKLIKPLRIDYSQRFIGSGSQTHNITISFNSSLFRQ